MTDTEKAALERRIYDRCLVRVGQLEAEKAVLERRIDELCAEVERGKAEFKKMDVWHSQELKAAMDENAKLRDENTELRKLGGFMLRCISQYHDCADCLVNGEHCEISYIEADARELGVTA